MTLLDKWGMRVHAHYLHNGAAFEVEDATRAFSIPPTDIGAAELLRRYTNLGWFRAEPIDQTPGVPAKRWRFYALVPKDRDEVRGEPFAQISRIGRCRSVFELGAQL